MSEKESIGVQYFGGINKLHTRQPGQLSAGKNFYTKSGSMYTRDGITLLADTPFTNPIRSIHSAGKVQTTTRLLVEEGGNLWHRLHTAGDWEKIKSNVAGNGYSSTAWSIPQGNAFLILASGSQGLVYNIAAGTLSNLINNDGAVPNFEFVTTWRGFVWGWATNWPGSNLIRFCGYDTNQKVSIDYWPLDFAINPSEDPGEPVLAAHPFGSHMFILTPRGYYRIYGYSEDNFEVTRGGKIGVYAVRCSSIFDNSIVWLGQDKKVYLYSGTSANPISEPVDELLRVESAARFVYATTYAMGNQFWLVLPDVTAGTTRVYVFDLTEKAWFVFEYSVVIKCGCLFGSYMDIETPYFGLYDNRVLSVGGTTDLGEAITSEFNIGPFYIDSRKFKLKRVYFNAEPRNDFTLSVSTVTDQDDEQEQGDIEFEAGGQVAKDLKISGVKGQNVSLRVSTTDKINELQSATLVITPKSLR